MEVYALRTVMFLNRAQGCLFRFERGLLSFLYSQSGLMQRCGCSQCRGDRLFRATSSKAIPSATMNSGSDRGPPRRPTAPWSSKLP